MYVAIDIGGTKVLVATLTPEGAIKQQAKFPTPPTYEEFLTQLEAQLYQFGEQKYEAAAVAVPDTAMDRQTGTVVAYGNQSWVNTPVKADLEKLLNCPVVVENDAKTGGLAEALLVINEYKKVLYITIGTGIGYAYIVDGVIDTSLVDGGGRVMPLEHDGTTEPWEDFASGSAIVRQYGKKAAEITDEKDWKAIVHNFSLGIFQLLKTVSPDTIIIGGGVGAHFDRFGALLEAELKQERGGPIPPLRQAKHAEEAVIHGCYALIKQVHNGKTAS